MKRLFWLIPVLWCVPSFAAAPTRVGGCANEGTSPISCTVSAGVSTGQLILVQAGWLVASGTIAVADNCGPAGATNTYTVKTPTSGSGGSNGVAYATVGAITASCQVTVTQSGGAGESINVYVANNAQIDTGSTCAGIETAAITLTNTPAAGSCTTTSTDLVVGFFVDAGASNNATLTAGAGYARQDFKAGFPGADEDLTQGASGATNPGWTYGTTCVCAVAGFFLAPIPPTGPPSVTFGGGGITIGPGVAVSNSLEGCNTDEFIDFSASGGSNGVGLTVANLGTATHSDGLISGSWQVPNGNTGFTYQSSAQQTLINSLGCSFYLGKGSGVLGVQWATNTGSTPWPTAGRFFTPTGTCVDSSVNETHTIPTNDGNSYDTFEISSGANDFVIWQNHTAPPQLWNLECKSAGVNTTCSGGTNSGSTMSAAANTPVTLRIHYQANGTHTGYIYDNNPLDAVKGVAPLLCSISCAATGNNLPLAAVIGITGAEAETSGNTVSWDSLKINATSCAPQLP